MKKNLFSLLLVCSLVLSVVFLSPSAATEPKPAPLFIVEYTTGSSWDNSKEFFDQKHGAFHSGYLNKLRTEGHIRFGARYADKGIIFISANGIDDVERLVNADSAVIGKLFNVKVSELDVFYKYDQSK